MKSNPCDTCTISVFSGASHSPRSAKIIHTATLHIIMATPKPLSSPRGLRATQTPQAYDRRAAEERRQIVRQYREQERRNQALRESEAQEKRDTAEREYSYYKAEAENLRKAESDTASAAAAFNDARERFNNAKTAEEQKRIEPELLRRADEYNAASKNLEERAFLYNASVDAAKKAGVIAQDAKGVNYKAERLDVKFEKQEQTKAEQPEAEKSQEEKKPFLSKPESDGPAIGVGLPAGSVVYVPQSQADKVVFGTQKVTTPGTVANTGSLIVNEPKISEIQESTIQGDGLSNYEVSDRPLMKVEDAFANKNALEALDALRVGVGTRLVTAGIVANEYGPDFIGSPMIAAGKVLLDPTQLQKDNAEEEKKRQEESIKLTSAGLLSTGLVVSKATDSNLGAPLVWAGKDVLQNLPYATDGIKITDKGIENLPSPGFTVLAGLTTGALLGAAGAAGAFAGGFGNPINAFKAAPTLTIEGEAAVGGIGGGSAGAGTASAVVNAEQTVGQAALAGLGVLSGKNEVGMNKELDVSSGGFLSGKNEFALPSDLNVNAGGLGVLSGKNEVGMNKELDVSSGGFLSGKNEFALPSDLNVNAGGLGVLSGRNETSDSNKDQYSDEFASSETLKEEDAKRTTGATAVAASFGLRPSNRVNNSEIDILDYGYGNVTINPEKTREEYTKRTPFIEVNKNPYEYASQNRVQNQNRMEAYFAYDFPAQNSLRNRKKLDIDLPELNAKPKKKSKTKSKSRQDDFYFARSWLPEASDLFAQPKRKRKNNNSSLLTPKKNKGKRPNS